MTSRQLRNLTHSAPAPLIHPLCSPGPSLGTFESRMVCAHVGANATADNYNSTADYYGMYSFACVYKDSNAWVTYELLRMCACVGGTRYVIRTSGRCEYGTQIRSSSECSAAAKHLNLYDQSVSLDYQYRASHDPSGCYYEGGSLKFNNYGGNYGYCSSYDKCVCKYYPKFTTSGTFWQ